MFLKIRGRFIFAPFFSNRPARLTKAMPAEAVTGAEETRESRKFNVSKLVFVNKISEIAIILNPAPQT